MSKFVAEYSRSSRRTHQSVWTKLVKYVNSLCCKSYYYVLVLNLFHSIVYRLSRLKFCWEINSWFYNCHLSMMTVLKTVVKRWFSRTSEQVTVITARSSVPFPVSTSSFVLHFALYQNGNIKALQMCLMLIRYYK